MNGLTIAIVTLVAVVLWGVYLWASAKKARTTIESIDEPVKADPKGKAVDIAPLCEKTVKKQKAKAKK
ncbi:MAG: hypothetical protein ACSLE0_23445 [Chitinophagaceae bacterium]